MRRYLALDFETTGLDPVVDRLIEVGAVEFELGREHGRYHTLVDPGRSVPAAIVSLTGIDPRELAGQPPPGAALAKLIERLDGLVPVGHGTQLEAGFLAAQEASFQVPEFLDTLDLARAVLLEAPGYNLAMLCGLYGLEHPRPHRALDDAVASRLLLELIAARLRGLPDSARDDLARIAEFHPQWVESGFLLDALQWVQGPRSGPVEPPPVAVRPDLSDQPESLDPAWLAGLISESGPLAGQPGFEFREPQREMLLAVAQSLTRGGRLLVEAGTGTGKSLAYLIPAAAVARARRRRVVISTHTLSLQDQLMERDLPQLAGWLPWRFTATVLKGRASYLSLRRWRRRLESPCRDRFELLFRLKLVVWLARTSTGDRAELRLPAHEEELWQQVASDASDCVGWRCTPETCFPHRARWRAEQSDLVVVNHSLLLAAAGREGAVLPEFEALVVDEAHHLEDAATASLRRAVSGPAIEAGIDRLIRSRPGGGPEGGALLGLAAAVPLAVPAGRLEGAARLAARAREHAHRLFEEMADEAWKMEPSGPVYPFSERLREEERFAIWKHLASQLAIVLDELAVEAADLAAAARAWGSSGEVRGKVDDVEAARFELATQADTLSLAFEPPAGAELIAWLQTPARGEGPPTLHVAPREVGPLLADLVFAPRSGLVLTSATLSAGDAGGFDYIASRLGLGEEVEALSLPGPFDYARQALIYLPDDLPGPDDPELTGRIEEVVAQVVTAIDGRTLVLFTSHQQLEAVHAGLRRRPGLEGLNLLGQRIDGGRTHLLHSFRTQERCVLLGTDSFWEGVDVPGDRLSCVIIARLPFPVPSDPIYGARAERLRDPFRQLALPRAAIRLKQGFGRLIRTAGDRGAVVIMDRRLRQRDYGAELLASLPPAAVRSGPAAAAAEVVGGWIRGGGRGSAETAGG